MACMARTAMARLEITEGILCVYVYRFEVEVEVEVEAAQLIKECDNCPT